ncbi:uncharacterized protein N7477_003871 [Penicillium maclennaniae]|uniref:uncharacterized protein n=1 Tax=Penicillium maclennaniae TaxID=1343394 RepID=UPI0025424E3E|nr:uncharacterized protein N7477_003871 [Penicillium maclennaniae]KAJ5678238.1 hypothetical protein N7477_003871 [Penicillium maclennaniae]
MGNDGAPNSLSTIYGVFSSQLLDRSGLSAVWHFCNEARVAAQRSTLSDVANYLQFLYRDESVNRGQIVFLTTLAIAMAGCGFLSCLVRRRRSDRTRLSRFSIRNITSKSSTRTLTSSSDDDYEDDEYDSNGSLRHATNPQQKAPEWSMQSQQQTADAFKSDPGLLKKYTTYNSYTTSVATYPAIRTFFCPHPNQSRLPTKPTPLPLLVVVHGLGGSLAQFHHLLKSLSNVGSCFGIDLPGCGLSKFAPTEWDAYTVGALAELLAVAIERHRDQENGQEVILIGHSLGCSLSALLASSTSSIGKSLKPHICGLIAVCPRADPPSAHEVTTYRRLLHIPGPIFDLWRLWDRRGGIESASVMRMVGSNADAATRDLQVRFNKQSQTPVWRRMAWGSFPTYNGNEPVGGMPGEKVWAGINMPILLVAGEADAVTKPVEIQKLLKFFGDSSAPVTIATDGSSVIPDASRVRDQISTSSNLLSHDEKYGIKPTQEEKQIDEVNLSGTDRKRLVKSAILPSPASHALLYDRATYRTLAGIIQDFLSHHIDKRLALGWQLQYMNTSGKWDVKNLAKWQKVAPVSEPIANTFAALKMLREVDEQHNPVLFSQKYRDRIYAVIDISHECPVYNPATMEAGGIRYCKHPTVSKIPPTPDETRDFIDLVDRLQGEIDVKMEKREDPSQPRPLVGVHCHYGYNRTGFLIVCYLIERLGFGVQEAIDEFNRCRAPGIRHEHFIDTLFVRYCVGLKRAPTL